MANLIWIKFLSAVGLFIKVTAEYGYIWIKLYAFRHYWKTHVHQIFCGLCYSSWPFWKFNLRLCCMEKYWNCIGVIESSHFMSLLYICVWKYEIPVFLLFQVENRHFKNKSNRLIFYCTDLWEKWYLSGAFYVSYTWVYINIFLFLSPASHFK